MLVGVTHALPDVSKQVIIVDDCSSDETAYWLRRNFTLVGVWRRAYLDPGGGIVFSASGYGANDRGFTVVTLFHERNRGKGAAVRTGLTHASGEVMVIRDADLEYDPNDWSPMLPLIVDRQVANVVYGSRFYDAPHRALYYCNYWTIQIISFVFNTSYNQMLSDFLRDLTLTSEDFAIEIGISTEIARPKRWRIYELGISCYGRTYEQGKKINWRDSLKALIYFFKFRFQSGSRRRVS